MLRDNRDEQHAYNKLREQIDYLMELGEKANDLNDFEHALRAYRRALEMVYIIKDYSMISIILANLTNVYAKLGKFDLAEELYREAIERLKSRELRKPEESELTHYRDLQQLELRHSALSSMRRPSSRL